MRRMLGYVVRAKLKKPSLGWMGNSLKGLAWAGASGKPRHPIMESQYSAAPGDLSTLPQRVLGSNSLFLQARFAAPHWWPGHRSPR